MPMRRPASASAIIRTRLPYCRASVYCSPRRFETFFGAFAATFGGV
jgi:hypothetical protein